LEQHIGFVAGMINLESIAESLLEEFFFGHSLRDDFDDTMRGFSIPTDKVSYARTRILQCLCEQVHMAFEGIWPSRHYSYQFIPGGDLIITETSAVPVFGRLTQSTWDAHESNHHRNSGHLDSL